MLTPGPVCGTNELLALGRTNGTAAERPPQGEPPRSSRCRCRASKVRQALLSLVFFLACSSLTSNPGYPRGLPGLHLTIELVHRAGIEHVGHVPLVLHGGNGAPQWEHTPANSPNRSGAQRSRQPWVALLGQVMALSSLARGLTYCQEPFLLPLSPSQLESWVSSCSLARCAPRGRGDLGVWPSGRARTRDRTRAALRPPSSCTVRTSFLLVLAEKIVLEKGVQRPAEVVAEGIDLFSHRALVLSRVSASTHELHVAPGKKAAPLPMR